MAVIAMSFAITLDSICSWNVFFRNVPLHRILLFVPFTIVGNPVPAAAAGVIAWATLELNDIPSPEKDWLDLYGRFTVIGWGILAVAIPIFDLDVLAAFGIP